MARPETIADLEITPIEFATVDLSKIGTEAQLLKGYADLLEAVGKVPGTEIVQPYGSLMKFMRQATAAEQDEQLARAQLSWDDNKMQYEKYAAVGSLEYTYLESMAKGYAESEGLPYPPEADPILPFDAAIRDIDGVVR